MEKNYKDYTPEIDYNDGHQASIGNDENSQKTTKPNKQTSKKNKKQQKLNKKQPSDKSVVNSIKEIVNNRTLKVLLGIFLGSLGIYLLVAFISYISTCVQDQSIINETTVGTAKNIANKGGEGGARLSEFLINESFGLGSFVIIVWLIAMSMKHLVGVPHFKSVNFTIKCLVGLITLSLIVGISNVAFNSHVNWGGYHSRYIYEFLDHFIGGIGSFLLCVFMVAVFASISLRDLIVWIKKKNDARLKRKAELAAIKAEEDARNAEMQKDEHQERIDDMKAGETYDIANASTFDDNVSIPDTHVSFSSIDDKPLYNINDSLEEEETEKSGLNIRSKEDTLIESAEPRTQTNDNESDNTSSSINSNQETADADELGQSSMTVKVNEISQTDSTRRKNVSGPEGGSKYTFPPFTLLREGVAKISVDAQEQTENKAKIEQTLLSFGIPITNITATVGPTVTLYEIVPDSGVKIARIRSLVDDIALSLSAHGVRIIAPIPGKGTVGIEVANKDALTVSMQTVIRSKRFQETKFNLPIALGSTISNEVYMADLSKMPHLLVAGATGQGKSVGLNAIVASLLYSKSPSQLKFVMIDPKQVEFSLYNKLKNYYMAVIPEDQDSSEPVITDMQKVEATLNSLCIEMENRYTLLKAAHVRNLEEYNAKVKDGKLNPNEGHKFLPYIVVIVDEFGDLIMVSGKNVEMPIARLAQKARAVGMHVIIATQRPSTNVITGIIKANFPARISFKVTSGVDSKTILDTTGAQHLIGRGDMLIFNNSEIVRVQCAFIDTPEVEALCDYVSRQPYPQGVYLLPEPPMTGEDAGGSKGGPIGERDPLFEEAARRVVSSNTASTSSLQRVYAIGYNRAGKIMDQLEACGIVGPSQGGKPRAVLVDMVGLESILASL